MKPEALDYHLSDGRRIPGMHQDAIKTAGGAFEFFGGELGPSGLDSLAHAIIAYLGWMERYEQEDATRRLRTWRLVQDSSTLVELRARVRRWATEGAS